MWELSANVAFAKATNGQVDIKNTKLGKHFSSMSLLKIVGEKLDPSLAKIVFGNELIWKLISKLDLCQGRSFSPTDLQQ